MTNLPLENTQSCPSCGHVLTGSQPIRSTEFTATDPPSGGASWPVGLMWPAWIGRRYERLNRLGQGGMGAVFLAYDHTRQQCCALKLLRPELVADSLARRRFYREGGALRKLSHPHVVSYYDRGETDDGVPFLIMEYVVGPSLRTVKNQSDANRLGVSRTLRITVQIAEALWHAQRVGIIHRDIKPENILLTKQGNQPDWVMLLDLGLAHIVGEKPITTLNSPRFGTVEYMAPELIADTPTPGPSVDVYSLGVLLHDLIIGTPPFSGRIADVMQAHQSQPPPSLSQRVQGIAGGIPAALDQLVMQMLDKNPARRPATQLVHSHLVAISRALPRYTSPELYNEETYVLLSEPVGHAIHDAPTQLLPKYKPPSNTARAGEDLAWRKLWLKSQAVIKEYWPYKSPPLIRRLVRQSKVCLRELKLNQRQVHFLRQQVRLQQAHRAHGEVMSGAHQQTLPIAEVSAQLARLQEGQIKLHRTLTRLCQKLAAAVVKACLAPGQPPSESARAASQELQWLLVPAGMQPANH